MFETILLAVDGSEGAEKATSLAADLAKSEGAKLVIAHIDERIIGKGGGDIQADEGEIKAAVQNRAEELAAAGIQATVEFRDAMLGGPAHAIGEIAKDVGADLIVVGTRGHSPVSGLLLGSVTQRLLHISPCPVLTVPVD